MTSAEHSLALDASRKRLFDAINGLTEEQFRYTPDVATWNIAAHLAHLLRTERLFAERARAALTEDEPFIASTRVQNDDDPALAQRLAVPQIIHGMQACRRDLELVLHEAGDAGLSRTINHERIGPMSIAAIVQKMSDHENEHAADVERLARDAASRRRTVIPLAPRA